MRTIAITTVILLLLTGCAFGPQTSGKASTKGEPATVKLDPAQAQRVQQIMGPLIQHMNHPLPPNKVQVSVLNSADINAANAGGGKFYVTAGLLQKANDEELRGVLAHEIAHEDLGHVARTQALGTGVQIGTILLDQILPGSGVVAPYVADLGIMKPYSRQEEYEADAHGVEILQRAGYDGKKVMADTLTWILQSSGPSGGFFTNHPGTEDRIQRLAKMK